MNSPPKRFRGRQFAGLTALYSSQYRLGFREREGVNKGGPIPAQSYLSFVLYLSC